MNKIKTIITITKEIVEKETLKMLIQNGADAIKIDILSNDIPFLVDVVNKVNQLNKELKTYVAIIVELKGPTIHTGKITNNTFYNLNDKIRISTNPLIGDFSKFSVDYPPFINEVLINTIIKVNNVELQVLDKGNDYLLCKVTKQGTIPSFSKVITNIKLDKPFLSNYDRQIIKICHDLNIDFIALKDVSNSEDILQVNDILINLDNDHIQLLSKISTNASILDIDNIIKVSDGIIISQNDLAIEIPIEKIPGIQKQIITKCHQVGVTSIVEASLTNTTKSEVSDIANAILDATEAILLTNENSVNTLKMLERIIYTVQKDINYNYMLEEAIKTEKKDTTGSLAYSVASCANRLQCKAIFTPTISGYTAKKISRFRPISPIIAISPNESTVKSLALTFGVYPVLIDEINTLDKIIEEAKKIAINNLLLKTKDNIIITGGYPFKKVKHTNFMKIEEI